MITIQKGQVLARGVVDWGDHVLVNKFSYHFRKPERGEVFVFTTKHISGIDVPREQGSQHYIKRLGLLECQETHSGEDAIALDQREARRRSWHSARRI